MNESLKAITPSFILGALVYAVSVIWFIAVMSSSVSQNAEHIKRVERRVEFMETSVQDQAVAMARIDENIKAIRELAEFWSSKK
jgi:type VI protein secretion system component VasK|tara:strand:- start:7100 stop:7351 length:252 start_codon:yes stop_codon:yes gene_type:complete